MASRLLQFSDSTGPHCERLRKLGGCARNPLDLSHHRTSVGLTRTMKTIILLTIALLTCALTSIAENCRYVSLTTTNSSNPAVINILEGEAGELINSS